ncbi:MAG: yiaD [Chitinophagaceae bacterium]|nr:yiaD [Chitinophagaceae bacterium]
MKPFSLLFLILSLLHPPLYAQSQLLINESFDGTSAIWYTDATESYSCKIHHGSYQIENKTKGGNSFSIPALIDPALDFEIEASLMLTGGTDNYGFGLFAKDIRSSANQKEHYFTISGNGLYSLSTFSPIQKLIVTKPWTTSTTVRQGYHQPNVLKIKKTQTQTSFFINDTLVYSTPGNYFWGTKIGFVVYNEAQVHVDYITVKQDRGLSNELVNTKPLIKENMGSAINTKHDEFFPVISSDGNTLYLGVSGDENNVPDKERDDVWYSTSNSDGTWSKRQNIGYPINNAASNFVISVTPDNNSLILHDMYDEKANWKGNGFSISHRNENGWSIPEDMLVDKYYTLGNRVSYCISPDRKVLLLAIEREDGLGQNDLYVSFQKRNNTWTVPKNMGSTINTYGDEESPFVAADGKTLYFSTNGKMGYGNNDIFMTKRLDDTWTHWSEPVNLGSNINSENWDAYYTIPASADYAYLVSDKNSIGLSDIFRIKVSDEAKPEPVVIIYGKVLDKNTHQPLGATISYHNLSTSEDAGSARSNPEDGSYKIILPYGKAYGFLAEKKDFLAESDNMDLTATSAYTEIERNLYLSPIEIGKTITLNNVFFVRSKPELIPDSYSELDRLVTIMNDNPELKIELSGHTDNVGDAAINLKLSEQRVQTIKTYLTSKHISPKRITGKGYGGTRPVASNATEETRKLNRRVEFTVISK